MVRDPVGTRERILEAASEMVVRRGFAGMSIDALVAQAGVTKGAFFHHFKGKDALARAIIEHHAAQDYVIMADLVSRSEKMSRDPRQQILIIMGLLAEAFDAPKDYPGCLFASTAFESGVFDPALVELAGSVLLAWRDLFLKKLREADAQAPFPADLSLDTIADMPMVIFEGAFIMARTTQRLHIIAAQMRTLARLFEVLFMQPQADK
ncbi:MAG: TetR/AcrR family transcriptional regulator [Myxococcota bacterium]|nr:helix-turn-helix domain-containing protein [Myxococcota bacterium]